MQLQSLPKRSTFDWLQPKQINCSLYIIVLLNNLALKNQFGHGFKIPSWQVPLSNIFQGDSLNIEMWTMDDAQ
jgi:hypothetical protein